MHFSAASRILADLTAPEPPLSSSGDEAASMTIPGYHLLCMLGSGSGGEVFKAVRDGSDHPIAIKILRTPLSDKAAADRAWRELDLLESLRLPALPRILDYGIAQGRLYFATEFIDGLPIDEHCATGGSPASAPAALAPLQRGEVSGGSATDGEGGSDAATHELLSLRARVSLLSRLASAVQSLHEHGVIHRDLKPSNILIDRSGNPVIIDLGIAALLESASGGPMATLTEAGAPIGTPAFMSPEQARGQRHLISTRSDVYSLGAVATLLLTGRTPHDIGGFSSLSPASRGEVSGGPAPDGEGSPPARGPRFACSDVSLHEAIRRAAEDEPLDPRSLDPTLPRPLAAILSKACAREPAARYPTAADFAADLDHWLRGEPVTAAPIGRWRKAARWAGRHPILTTAAACVLLLAGSVVGSMFSVWLVQRRPYIMRKDVSPRPRWAELRTLGGSLIRRWDTGENHEGIMYLAELVTAPDGRRLAITLMESTTNQDQSGRLCVWDADDPFTLLWSTQRTPEEGLKLPPIPTDQEEEWGVIGTTFRANGGLVADVFTDVSHPGPELIVSSVQDSDPSFLSVFTLSGELLYRVWHWGSCSTPLWLKQRGLIIVNAADNTAKYSEMGFGNTEAASQWPWAIVAIKPILGVGVIQPAAWLNTRSASRGLGLQWYRYASPVSNMDRFDMSIRSLPNALDGSTLFRLRVQIPGDGLDALNTPEFWFDVDGEGQRVAVGANDYYNTRATRGEPPEWPLPTDPGSLLWLTDTPEGAPAAGWEGTGAPQSQPTDHPVPSAASHVGLPSDAPATSGR